MSLTKARKIISFILSVLIVMGGNLFFNTTLIRYTVCNEKYMLKVFSSDELNEQCKTNFKDRAKVLEAKSSIPARVFESINAEDTDINKTAVARLFRGEGGELFNNDIVERFEGLCTEYLKGNAISYDKEKIYNTAVLAARVYSDSFGIGNSERLMDMMGTFNSHYSIYWSAGLLLMAVSCVLILVLYSKKRERRCMFYSSFSALGLSLITIGAGCIIFKPISGVFIGPEMYAAAMEKAFDGAAVILIVLGLLLAVVFFAALVTLYKKRLNSDNFHI